MAQQTAVEWLVEELNKHKKKFGIPPTEKGYMNLMEKANKMFHEQVKDAVIYGLDEDGHTGDWKISVAENYYIKTYTK